MTNTGMFEDAKDYFFKNKKNLDSIEGIWYDAASTMTMRQTLANKTFK